MKVGIISNQHMHICVQIQDTLIQVIQVANIGMETPSTPHQNPLQTYLNSECARVDFTMASLLEHTRIVAINYAEIYKHLVIDSAPNGEHTSCSRQILEGLN